MGTDIELVEVSDEQALAAIRGAEVELEVTDPKQATLAMVDRILNQQDAKGVLATNETTPAVELDGVALQVHGFRWVKSRYRSDDPEKLQPGVFAVVDATRLDDGSAVTVTVGSTMVMAQLYKLRQLDVLGAQPVKIVRKPETAAGYRPMNLEPA